MSDAKRALLEKYLSGGGLELFPESRIAPRPRDEPALPSFGQEQLWIHAQLVDDPTIYNEPLTVRRTGPLDVEALRKSLNEIIRRHEAWRTNFAIQDGQLVQVINPILELDLPFVDLSQLDESEREAEAVRLATQDARRPFSLSEGPLLRVLLIRLSDIDHRLYITLHQIIFDGVSMYSVFLPELEALYESFVNGEALTLPELRIQYADFAHWQQQRSRDETLADQTAFWKKQLAGAPVLDFPTDRSRPAIQTFRGEQLPFTFSQLLSEKLKALSRSERTTLFMTLLAAFQTVLHRYTDQDDLVVGTVKSNRNQSEFEELAGFFLNTLVLRTDVSGNPTFRELLARTRQVTVDALAHGDVPIHSLVKELELERDPSRNPLFQVMFVLEPPLPEPGPGWELSQTEVDTGIARVDLYLELDDRPEGLVGRIRYNTDLFERESIERLLAHLTTLLEAVVENPERAISDYSLHTANESAVVQVRPANTFTPFAKKEIEQSIGARFESQVRKYPGNIAVKTARHCWSYAELNQRANKIAQTILDRFGDGEERICLLFEHDAPMISALLGALKAGKTYVPLDPTYPSERLAFILANSEATALLTNDQNLALAQQLVSDDAQLINIDHLDVARQRRNAPMNQDVTLPSIKPDRLAYILYTSGSTGKPKGVMQNHRNVLHYIRAYTNNLHLSSADRLTLLSSYCFDASVMDIYGALLNGATLCPINIKQEGLAGLSQQLIDEEITVYHSTPTVYRYFTGTLNREIEFPQVRLVVLGGEKVNRTDVETYQKYFSDNCIFVNGLGPTEATVALQNFVNKQTRISTDGVPVGFPVADTDVLLLNKDGKPTDVCGEIAIKSKHVAVGYWRNPDATANAFSTNGQGPGVRIYRTGDMGRRLPDGRITFAGRKDFQVKVRGHRIELGEIESALAQHPCVRESVVVARENSGDTRLVSYVVPRVETLISGELRDYLKQKLPEYMVPSSFVMLDALPLTASGKLNLRALPAPVELRERSEVTFAAPQTPVEQSLATIWAEVLGINAVGVHDNFFDLGGHSLRAVHLFARIEKEFGKRLPLATLFQSPTIAELATAVQEDPPASWSSLVPIQPQGSRAPFFCIHAVGGNVLEYYDLARHLGPDQPFYGLQSRGLDGTQSPHERIDDMAAHYIKEVRELQPHGPYFLGGRSLGGIIAYEMACQLSAQGEEVALLALLDSYPVGYARLAPDAESLRNKFVRALRRAQAHLSNLKGFSLREKAIYLVDKAQYIPVEVKSSLWRMIFRSYQNLGRDLPDALRDVEEFNWLAARNFVPKLYDGRATLFWASSDLRAKFDLIEGWQTLARAVDIHDVPGNHLDIIKEPYVADLAAKLRRSLALSQNFH
ncbi:MAG TPA: amino acid adenylation domain-containing protein [Pyrinomonadaceae bacterium]|nr:amino acid adenylation domain-containing protein [Pyrinomonadaceae bacterium]